jgi:hypothetical protein
MITSGAIQASLNDVVVLASSEAERNLGEGEADDPPPGANMGPKTSFREVVSGRRVTGSRV